MIKILLLMLFMISVTACYTEVPNIPPSLLIKAVYPDGRPLQYNSEMMFTVKLLPK